jgi:hypothetical protein
MPIGSRGAPVFAVFPGPFTMADFYVPANQPPRYRIFGITKDSGGSALGGCNVEVFETASGLLRGATVSDATGNYSIDVTGSEGMTFFAVAYKAGSPDVTGVTVNTLVGV